MNIVYITCEVAPFATTGGLGDVGGALPIALEQQDLKVIRIMPMYRSVMEGDFPKSDTGIRLKVPVGLRSLQAEFWKADTEGPATYFVRKDEFFDRSQLYSLPERDYDDNYERFVFFQKAAVGLIDHFQFKADIVHANDWQTALIPYFLEHGIHGMGRGRGERVVFTIHNLAFQGIFTDHEFPYSNLPYSCFSLEDLEFYGNLNCMKGALLRADAVTTVSQKYAQEILTPEFGCGLEGVLARISHKLTGIVNGVDYKVWDPENDPHLPENYTPRNLKGKAACKRALLEEMGFSNVAAKAQTPLIGIVTRLVDQKGLDLLAEALEEIMAHDLNFVLLGSGQEKYENLCREWAARWPERLAIHIGYDTGLSHRIEAGSDIFLMPSRFEPCGLNQLYSLKYGTIPLVHATGGLDDTIDAVHPDGTHGTGFKFNAYTTASLLEELDKALTLYQRPAAWREVQLRGMQKDFSWDRSARKYRELYTSLVPSATEPDQ